MKQLKQNYVYVILSQTATHFGKVIRIVTGNTYNHASVAFDEDMHEIYGFARKQHNTPVLAGLVKEYPERFCLDKEDIKIKVYRIPVSEEGKAAGKRFLNKVKEDPEGYLYNLYSVVSFPIIHGFETYKSYSCTEFVANLLLEAGAPCKLSKPACKYLPEELGEELEEFFYYEGSLRQLCDYDSPDEMEKYLKRMPVGRKIAKSAAVLIKLASRKLGA